MGYIKVKGKREIYFESDDWIIDLGGLSIEDLEQDLNIQGDVSKIPRIHLNGNIFKSFDGIEIFESLETIHADNNIVKDVSALENLKNLSVLNLKSGKLTKIPNLGFLSNTLECLYLDRNNIRKIDNLNQLAKLQKLTLRSNNISEIENLEKNSELWFIDLGNNQISEIKNLGTLKNLKILKLDRNRISSVKGIEKLLNLKELYLQYNEISRFPINIKNFPYLEQVTLKKNPLIKSDLESVEQYCNNHNIYFID
ncbi:MAG: leucine-rich repeat domain-containing protein [Promethearchaeota archaeon]|nr:MAG: leucine-rich repeat domain-containing protein [Candidatus Lokiarchaeota archaeon]